MSSSASCFCQIEGTSASIPCLMLGKSLKLLNLIWHAVGRVLPRNMAVLKVRMTFLLASQQAGAFALSPIAGVISQFGLFWPWHHDQGLKLLEAFF